MLTAFDEHRTWWDTQNDLLLTMILTCAPQRLDYATIQLKDDGDNNYVDLENKKVILRHSKTATRANPTVFDISDEVVRLIKELVQERGGKSPFLFQTRKWLPFTKNYMGRFISELFLKVLGKSVSMNSIRHRAVSMNVDLEYEAKRAELAKQMGHSVGTANQFYAQPVPTESGGKILAKTVLTPVKEVVSEAKVSKKKRSKMTHQDLMK